MGRLARRQPPVRPQVHEGLREGLGGGVQAPARVDLRADRRAPGRQTDVFLALDTYNDILGWCNLSACGNPPPNPPQIDKAVTIALDAWNTMTCETAKAAGFTCADVYHLFNGPKGTTWAGDLLAADYTHPSQAGNDKIADYLLSLGYGALQP